MDLVSWTFGGQLPDPDKPILIDALSPSSSLSYHQLVTKVRQLISGLRAQGIQPGDCVCVNCFNDLQYSVLYLGIIGAGAVFTGVNPAYTPNELRHHFDLTKPSLVIVEPPMLDKTLTAAKLTGISIDRVYAFDTETPNPLTTTSSWTTLLGHGESDWVKVEDPDTTVATYNSTSGTSGLPKAAMITHSYHVTQATAQCADTNYQKSRLLTLPPFHAFGSPILPSSIRQGVPTYIMRRYAESTFLNSITQYGITQTYVPPPVLMALPKSPLATRDGLSSLRAIYTGGASVKFAQQKPLYDVLHEDACIRSVWGMTEAGWITCVQDRTRRDDDSVGQPLGGFEIMIVDDDGNQVTADNVSGELLARVPHPLLSYISNPAATIDAFTPCKTYIRTGDIGYRLTDPATGKPSIFIVDRAKELIKVRGWQVSPTEIESELMQHPAIADAAVIGVKEPDGFEEFIRAYVVRKAACSTDAMPLDEKLLRTWLRERLTGYKIPAEFTFVAAVPRNGTGKILRRELRAAAAAETTRQPQRTVLHRRVDSGVSDTVHLVAAPTPLPPQSVVDPVPQQAVDKPSAPEQLPAPEQPPATEQQQQPDEAHLKRSKSPDLLRKKFKKFVKVKNKLVARIIAGWAQALREVKPVFERH